MLTPLISFALHIPLDKTLSPMFDGRGGSILFRITVFIGMCLWFFHFGILFVTVFLDIQIFINLGSFTLFLVF